MRSECLLAVKYHHQQSPDSCLAACVKMAVQYFGSHLDELEFYRKSRFSRKYPGLCDVCIASTLIKMGYKVVSYWDGRMEDWGVWTDELAALYKRAEVKAKKTKKYVHKHNASLETIKSFIDKHIPVISEVLAGEFYNTHEIGTHMVLIRGYDKRGLHICDPWSGQGFITYEHFMRSWSPNKVFGRSLIVILPE